MTDLKKFFDSDLHKRIILFFSENPSSVDSPRGIATWVGCSRSQAKKALDELVQAGILNSISSTSTAGYSFTQDKALIEEVRAYINRAGSGG